MTHIFALLNLYNLTFNLSFSISSKILTNTTTEALSQIFCIMPAGSKRPLSACVRKYREIPTVPFYKIVHTFTSQKNKSNIDLAFEEHFNDYGPLFRLSAPFEADRLFTRKPDHYREVLAAEGKWPVNTNFDFLVNYRGKFRRDLFPDSGGLIGSHGEEWFRIRSEVTSAIIT